MTGLYAVSADGDERFLDAAPHQLLFPNGLLVTPFSPQSSLAEGSALVSRPQLLPKLHEEVCKEVSGVYGAGSKVRRRGVCVVAAWKARVLVAAAGIG